MLNENDIQETINNLESLKLYVPDDEISKIQIVIQMLMDLPELPTI